MAKLSIIVPVYNVEKYIRPCFESIFRQGLDDEDYEVIIVNDGSTDKSMEMIADIIAQHRNITVIHQENLSLSVARNNGITAAQGDYILMPDSDDLLINNSLPYLLDKALETKADVVVADFLELTDKEVDMLDMHSIQQADGSCTEKTGEQLFMQDLSPYESYVWRSLFRRQFIIDNKLYFVPGILFQDVPWIHECYIKAQKCIRANWLLNIYRRREGSATFSFSMKKAQDFSIAIGKEWELSHMERLSPQALGKLQRDVFTSISILLWNVSHAARNAKEREVFIDFLKEKIPDLQFNVGIKPRIASFMYNRWPHTLIHCRYLYDTIIEDRILPFYRHKIKSKIKK